MAAPPKVPRAALSNFLLGGDSPGCVLCALAGRRALAHRGPPRGAHGEPPYGAPPGRRPVDMSH
eukprot:4502040-Alexandrium_andersonii.AAC.1